MSASFLFILAPISLSLFRRKKKPKSLFWGLAYSVFDLAHSFQIFICLFSDVCFILSFLLHLFCTLYCCFFVGWFMICLGFCPLFVFGWLWVKKKKSYLWFLFMCYICSGSVYFFGRFIFFFFALSMRSVSLLLIPRVFFFSFCFECVWFWIFKFSGYFLLLFHNSYVHFL